MPCDKNYRACKNNIYSSSSFNNEYKFLMVKQMYNALFAMILMF